MKLVDINVGKKGYDFVTLTKNLENSKSTLIDYDPVLKQYYGL